jgi:hypothetical protein
MELLPVVLEESAADTDALNLSLTHSTAGGALAAGSSRKASGPGSVLDSSSAAGSVAGWQHHAGSATLLRRAPTEDERVSHDHPSSYDASTHSVAGTVARDGVCVSSH